MLRMLDTFSGIGGFSLAARWTGGIETIAFCEIDPFCQQILKKHWPDVPIYGDVKTIKGDEFGTVDIITGGFPCQDLSCAGQRKGIQGERSGLWGELYKIMCQIRPRYTIIENVTGLLSGDNGRWFQRLLTDLAEGGFNAEWECIPASSLGAPHHRDRVYLIAYPSENGWLRIFTKTDLKVRRNLGHDYRIDWFGCGEGHWAAWQTKTRQELFAQSIIARKDDGISRWIHRNNSLGNSIVPQVAFQILQAIVQIEKEDK